MPQTNRLNVECPFIFDVEFGPYMIQIYAKPSEVESETYRFLEENGYFGHRKHMKPLLEEQKITPNQDISAYGFIKGDVYGRLLSHMRVHPAEVAFEGLAAVVQHAPTTEGIDHAEPPLL